MTPEDGVPLPSNIVHPGTDTVFAFDNIIRLEGTLSGGGISHCVNGIAVQPVTACPHQKIVVSKVDMTKKRSFSAAEEPLPIYNVGKRIGPPRRKVREVDGETNYLPTINAPATDIFTVKEALNRSLTIMLSLHLKSMICVFNQAIYPKAFEVKCKEYETSKPIVLRPGTFHTLGTLFSVIGKRCLHSGLKNLFIEAGVVAERSVSAVPEGRNYNRGVRVHKLAYEAFMRMALERFYPWLDESLTADSHQVQTCLDEIGIVADELCKQRHDEVFKSRVF